MPPLVVGKVERDVMRMGEKDSSSILGLQGLKERQKSLEKKKSRKSELKGTGRAVSICGGELRAGAALCRGSGRGDYWGLTCAD